MSNLQPQSIARGFSVTLAARVAAAVLGLLQLIVLAQVFGATAATDVWYAAIQVPMLFLVFVTGPLHTSFLPVYAARVEADGAAAGSRLVDALYTAFVPFLACIGVLLWLAAPTIVTLVAPGFSGERAELAVRIVRWLAPLPLLTGLAEFPAMLFLANRRYTAPALGSLCYALGVVIATYVLGDKFGIAVAAQGGLAAVTLEVIFLTWVLPGSIARPRLTRDYAGAGVGQVFRLLWPRFVTIGGGRLNLFVDNIFASTLPEGILASLNFGEKLTRIPVILFAGPLTRTIMPVFSEYAARGDTARIGEMLGRYLRLAAVLACAVGAVFVFFSQDTVRVFFGRGAFDAEAIDRTSLALVCYGVGMVSYAFRLLISTVFFALQDTTTPMKWSLIGIVVNVAADWLLLQTFGHGGIALATAVVETAVAVGLYRALVPRIGLVGDTTTRTVLLQCLVWASVCGGAAWTAAHFIRPHMAATGFWADLLIVACTAGPAGLVYLYALHRSGVQEVRDIVAWSLRLRRS